MAKKSKKPNKKPQNLNRNILTGSPVEEKSKYLSVNFSGQSIRRSDLKKCVLKEYKKLFEIIDKITNNEFQVIYQWLFARPIKNSKNYASLFRGLSPDVAIYETNLTASGRVFYFIYKDVCYIVAVERSHR